jgi:hypothetical protein
MLNKLADDEQKRQQAFMKQQAEALPIEKKQTSKVLEGNLALKFLMNPKELS